MILIENGLKEGDLVYLWWSLVNEKKPVEHEFRLVEKKDRYLKFHSINGNYDIFLGKPEIESFYGNIRELYAAPKTRHLLDSSTRLDLPS